MNYKFFLKFVILFLFFQYILFTIDLSLVEKGLAQTISTITNYPAIENKIYTETQVFEIGPNCTGLLTLAILIALLLSLEVPKKETKVKIFLVGLPIVLLTNLARIYLLLYVPKKEIFLVHTITWFLNAFVILAIWYYFYKKEK